MEPKRLRLLRVTKEGYVVGAGETRKNTHQLIPHEAVVAILTGLVEDKKAQDEATVPGEATTEYSARYAITDACRHARHQLAGIAWRLGLCSWDMTWRAIPKDANPFHQSD